MLTRLLFTLAVACLAAPALANGVISEFPAGGVVFKEAANIAIAREDLYLSLRQIKVRYEYRSDAASVETHTIGFPMPPVPLEGSPDYLGGINTDETPDLRNYMNFTVKVNGVPAPTKLHEFASYEGRDITAELAAIGLPAFLPTEAQSAALAKLDAATVAALVDKGWLYVGESGVEYAEPLWSYQTVYEWQQDFAPGKTVVEISYVPLNGYPSDIGQSFEGGLYWYEAGRVSDTTNQYCIDPSVVRAIKRHAEKGGYEVVTQGYVLVTGNFWKGPIEDFNLVVDKADPVEGMTDADLVAFCPLEARKISPTQFAWSAKNFEPTRDLSVVYYEFYDIE